MINERYILIAANSDNSPAELSELAELVRSAGGMVCGEVTQNLERIHPGHYFGSGKLLELKAVVEDIGASGVVCDDELSPAQLKNMEEALETRVIDRTALILDIFAINAGSAEAKAQVELAQLNYNLTRLRGKGSMLSRLGGGIGTRGPGETKLETDRRHIKNRIITLNREIKNIEAQRGVLRNKRQREGMPVVALVGYTNAGKSTVMNMLTKANVLSEDRLFATLDTTTRLLRAQNAGSFLLSDTVGFINKLPHHLIKAFRATLNELNYADILIHIIDAANPAHQAQTEVVKKTLMGLKIADKPIITVYNKIDLIEGDTFFPADCVKLSALTGEGKEELLSAIDGEINKLKKEITVLLPYSQGELLNLIHKKGRIITEEYKESGTEVCALVPLDVALRLGGFVLVRDFGLDLNLGLGVDDVDETLPLGVD